jgi:hypothetical protein
MITMTMTMMASFVEIEDALSWAAVCFMHPMSSRTVHRSLLVRRAGSDSRLLSLLQEMREKGVTANDITYNTAISYGSSCIVESSWVL